MDTDKRELIEHDLTEQVIGIFYDVYRSLGYGFLENVYENAMAIALRDSGVLVQQQASIAVRFRNQVVGEFRADLLVENRLIIELKAVSSLAAIHEVQLVNYLKATGIRLSLLLNFGSRAQFKRRVFG